jgi:hypothetical protein
MTFKEIINEVENIKIPSDDDVVLLIADQLQIEFEKALRTAAEKNDYVINKYRKEYCIRLNKKDLLDKYIIQYTRVYSSASEEDYITPTITDLGKMVLDELASRYDAQIIWFILNKRGNEVRLIIIPIEAELPEKEENK